MRKSRVRYGKRRLGLVCILAGAALLYLLLRSRLDPLVQDLAVAGTRNAVDLALQEAVAAHLAAGELEYSGLVTLVKDKSGGVTAAIANVGKMNAIQAALRQDVLNAMSDGATADLSVPLGNLLGVPLLSGLGPRIRIRILSVAQIDARLAGSFTASGINQSLHRIILELTAEVYVLVPGQTLTTEVYARLPLAETIIVGRVPDSYTYFEGSENWDESLEQFDIMT